MNNNRSANILNSRQESCHAARWAGMQAGGREGGQTDRQKDRKVGMSNIKRYIFTHFIVILNNCLNNNSSLKTECTPIGKRVHSM